MSVQKRSPYPATQVPCTCVSTHVCNMAEWVPCAAGTRLGQGGTWRAGHGLNCPGEKEGAGDTRGPYRGAFPRVAGCGGTDLKGSRACGRVVRVTWQGGAGAHGAASEGLPRGLWDRAGGGGGSSDRSKSMGGWGGCAGPSHPLCTLDSRPPCPEGSGPGEQERCHLLGKGEGRGSACPALIWLPAPPHSPGIWQGWPWGWQWGGAW